MSAPPIGMIISTPSTNAMAVITMNGNQPPPRKNQTPKTTIAIASARFSMCWPANTTGALRMRPDSLPNAITEPENVIAPMNVPMKSSSLLPVGISAGSPNDCRIVDRRDRDQHRRHADERVERRNQLRHLRHLHAPRDDRADRAADCDAGQDPDDVPRRRVDERERHRPRRSPCR